MDTLWTVKKSSSEVDMVGGAEEVRRRVSQARRRSGEETSFRIGGVSDEDDGEDDDIFVTPSSTPTNERAENVGQVGEMDVSEGNLEKNLYSIYDLCLNDLQTVIGE